VTEVATYVSIDPGGALNEIWTSAIGAAVPVMPLIAQALLSERSRRALGRLPEPVSDGAPSFAASIEVTSALSRAAMGVLAADAYTVTSEIVALGVECLLGSPPAEGGVLAPAQIVEPARALRELEARRAIAVLEPAPEGASQR
jgi:hypothetical protein